MCVICEPLNINVFWNIDVIYIYIDMLVCLMLNFMCHELNCSTYGIRTRDTLALMIGNRVST